MASTLRLILTGESEHDRRILQQAAAIIRAGGVVAFPTETVYGLGADALNPQAVRRIFEAKGRPQWDPLIVHLYRPEDVYSFSSEVPAIAEPLIRNMMPGPLTLVLMKSPLIPNEVSAGLPTVALRVPAHPVAQAFIATSGTPIAAPSANRFGRPSPTTAEHVLQDLEGRIDAVIDGGATPMGVESTVIDVTTYPPTLLRPGGTPAETIEALIGRLHRYRRSAAEGEALPSPGLSSKHYAPNAKVVLCEAKPNTLQATVQEWLRREHAIGVMRPLGWQLLESPQLRVYTWGEWGDWQTLASRLFAGLRWLESEGVEAIICPLPPAEGLALAIRDRLQRAASP